MFKTVKKLISRILKALRARINRILLNIEHSKKSIHVHKDSFIAAGTVIGFGTRINHASHIGKCEIGRYCACGGRLVVRSEDHHVHYLNMQDWLQHTVIGSQVKVAGKSKGPVIIGHASWLGDSVIILPGVKIGVGAVIGAGSVVTKDVPDFAIAVGNPAKVIKYRFSEEVATFVRELAWWNWSPEKIRKNREIFETDFSKISDSDISNIVIK
tara:strand:+ start:232 stop:870 length:639 start_codon:yes stop_codon:yes gene_type:complete